MRVLALDWGKAVGMAMWDGVEERHAAWVANWDQALDVLVPGYLYSEPTPPSIRSPRVDVVVCEDFEISSRTVKSGVTDGWKRGRELMFIGATEFMCRQTGVEFVLQSAVDAKQFASDDKLRRIGWYTSGADHSRDASRHLLLALARRDLIDLRELLAT